MQRNWDLIRLILLKLEGLETASGALRPDEIEGFDKETVSYHVRLLIEADLIEGECSRTIGAPLYCTGRAMTWEGHELLDRMRDATLWNRIKGTARQKGLDLSLDVIRQAAKALIEGLLG